MLAHTLREYAVLLRQRAGPEDLPAASAALAQALAIAADCGMTRLLAALDQPDHPDRPSRGALTLNREDDFWLVGYAGARARVPDSLGLRYLDLLVRNPGRELAAAELVRLAAPTGLGGRPRQLGAESERPRLNVTRAIRTAICRIRDRAPDAAAHLDQAVRTGTRCNYSPPDRP